MTEDKDAARGWHRKKMLAGHKFSGGGVQRRDQDVGDFWFCTVTGGQTYAWDTVA